MRLTVFSTAVSLVIIVSVHCIGNERPTGSLSDDSDLFIRSERTIEERKQCKLSKKCKKKNGKCIPKDQECDGDIINKGCKSKSCKGTHVCCAPKQCIPSKTCNERNGKCIPKNQECNGEIIRNGCKKSKSCKKTHVCCAPVPISPTTTTEGPTDPDENCKLKWNIQSSQFPPLILDSKDQIILPKGDKPNLFIEIESGKVLFACSGTDNKLQNFNGKDYIEGTCQDGELKINGEKKELEYMLCVNHIQSSIVQASSTKNPDQEKCGGPDNNVGRMWLIGFATYKTPTSVFPVIEVCFEMDEETTLFSKNTLHGESLSAKDAKFEKDFVTSPQFTIPMKTIYKEENEKNLFKQVPGVNIDFGKNLKFSKGHLAPRSDFITRTGQAASFYYLNALPQWQLYNGDNWARVEQRVEGLAKTNKVLLDVYTGGSGQMETPDKASLPIFLGQSLGSSVKKVPIPNQFWKVVTLSKSGNIIKAVAFVTNNNPLKQDPIDQKVPCTDVCEKLSDWINATEAGRLKEAKRGYTYCCNVHDLNKDDFPNIPKINKDVPLLEKIKD